MICPNCKCEYIRGVNHCLDCDVPLVNELQLQKTISAGDIRLVSAWRGSDPAECDKVQEALQQSGIPFTIPDSNSGFSLFASESTLEIWISAADRDKAKKIILDALERVDPGELTPEELESLALEESDQPDTAPHSSLPRSLPENWYEDEPVVEVWNGQSESLANDLNVCLREIGIASHKLDEAGNWRLVVLPEQESRAKEVVREVVEASPPE